MSFIIQRQHVHGHRDGKTITALPRDTWLNIKVDTVVKAAAEEHRSDNPPLKYDIPFSTWVCYVGSKQVVKQFSHELHTHLNSPALEKYWREKWALSQHQWAITDWDALDWTYMELPTRTRRWATKHASGHFSHGKNMVQWHFHTNLACQRCQAPVEDKLHVIRCPTGSEPWNLAMKNLQQLLKDWNTDHSIITALITRLTNWYNNSTTTSTVETDPLILAQNQVGWDYILDGWLSKQWCF